MFFQKTKSRFSNLIKVYGPVAVGTYASVSCVSLTFWYLTLTFGVDFSKVTDNKISKYLKIDTCNQTYAKSGTLLATIIALHTLIWPIRIGATLFLTPKISRRIIKLRP